jgi:Ala-tRNA(Pro) deacylase
MIPALVEQHLRKCHDGFEHHVHGTAMSAQELAAAEHVSGYGVAKPVVVRIDGEPAIAVVAAAQRLQLDELRRASGGTVELVSEWEFAPWFPSCELGAAPPLSIFGLPIVVDASLALNEKLVMAAGTHDDAVVLDTSRWCDCEDVQPIVGLGAHVH